MMKRILIGVLVWGIGVLSWGQTLDSRLGHGGEFVWKMAKASETRATAAELSSPGFDDTTWMEAIVPGTVLTSLVENRVYPEPYYGTNNKISEKKIPDIIDTGRDFWTYWFRTGFNTPELAEGERLWLHPEGINYRAEWWLNGHLVSVMAGMFNDDLIDITDFIAKDGHNTLAVLVKPVDIPGTTMPKPWGAPGENRNGGDGDIGWNTTQLMTVGWDFSYDDGIRDRNTGIWKSVSVFKTGPIRLDSPFIKSSFHNHDLSIAAQTITLGLVNPASGFQNNEPVKCVVEGEIEGTGIKFSKEVSLIRGEEPTVTFTPEDYPQLNIKNPRLWWPKNKGPQELYKLKLAVKVDGKVSDSKEVTFGIRDVQVTTDTPDGSKVFIVNGKRMFIRGSNWIPEAMLRTNDERMRTEMAYTDQSGINFLRLWGGGIAESDLFYQLCDEYGIMVWQEFWMTGDTRHPHDKSIYFNNVASTVKRIRNHPSIIFYVASNESTEVSGTPELLEYLDGTRPYQMQSECDGIHDGSPYKQVNPMRHYTNTASDRGSRVDGFNPEYGAPTLPVIESLKKMMPADKLWPIDKATWNYLDGNGFHLMTTLYDDMVRCYGEPSGIEDYARKGQLVGAMNSKSIWEVWNYNRLDDGDRFCSGLLFWYHNCPNVQVCARMWDYFLEPTASLFHTMHSLEPLHVQFDYLKNTVSIINDCLEPVHAIELNAKLYDLSSKLVKSWSIPVDVPAEKALDDVLTLDFPENISPVHFICLTLTDRTGKQVLSENIYWRSTDSYEGPQTVTGPCTSGFESLAEMPAANVKLTRRNLPDGSIEIILKNTSSKIAFFNRLQLRDKSGEPVHGTMYSDNFVTLLPHSSKTIVIKPASDQSGDFKVYFEGWNSGAKTF
jgi:hypothetical protein